MPHVSGPHTLDPVTVNELAEHRLYASTDASESHGALLIRVATGMSEKGTPVVSVSQHSASASTDQLRQDHRVVNVGRDDTETHDDSWPGHHHVYAETVECPAADRVSSEAGLTSETPTSVDANRLTDRHGKAIYNVSRDITINVGQQPLPYERLESTQVGRLSDETGASDPSQRREQI